MDPLDPDLEATVDPAAMRSALLAERRRALDELSETVQAPGQMTYGSLAAAGTFGICLRCGSAIAGGRLEALPWAAHCIACQAIVDRERR
jgi:DnaK suppressor protein